MSVNYSSTLDELLAKIRDGVFEVKTKLPPERELAKNLNVSRGNLREALCILEQRGLVEKRGNFRYVINSDKGYADERAYFEVLKKAEVRDLIEAREFLDDALVQLACERATEEDIARLETCFDKQTKRWFILGDKLGLDTLFHLSIAQASHNMALFATYSTNMELLANIRNYSMKSEERRKEIFQEHGIIFRAIKDRDVVTARLAMRLHIQNIKRKYGIWKES